MESSEFHVPHAFKIAFVWVSIAAIFLLVAYQFDKRMSYWQRHVRNVMQPVEISAKPDLNKGLEMLFSGQGSASQAEDSRSVLYHFWATWCAPCRAEIPTLNELQKRFASSLRVVAIAVDENKEDVIRFFADQSPQFQVLWDQSRLVSEQWDVQKYPETFLLISKEKPMLMFSGPRDWNSPEAVEYFSHILGQSS